jgi:hypothetical protein
MKINVNRAASDRAVGSGSGGVSSNLCLRLGVAVFETAATAAIHKGLLRLVANIVRADERAIGLQTGTRLPGVKRDAISLDRLGFRNERSGDRQTKRKQTERNDTGYDVIERISSLHFFLPF